MLLSLFPMMLEEDVYPPEEGGDFRCVAGHVFLPVPGIFFEYMKQTGKEMGEREQIQREFEQLNICKRRNNRRYWFARQLQDEQTKNGFKRKKATWSKDARFLGWFRRTARICHFRKSRLNRRGKRASPGLLALFRTRVVKLLHPGVFINRQYDHAIQA
ncbi:hypothetical protein ACU62C_22745 [Klebsiella aerogenes]